MKIVFIGASLATIYLIYAKFKATYDRNHDSFRIEFLLLPCLVLALLINHDFTVMEVSAGPIFKHGRLVTLLNTYFQVLWTFSIYLESVAILPQLFLVSKTGEAESITSHYLFALGSYRALYLLNWVSHRVMTGCANTGKNLQIVSFSIAVLSLLCGVALRFDCHFCWCRTNDPLLWLFLFVHYKGWVHSLKPNPKALSFLSPVYQCGSGTHTDTRSQTKNEFSRDSNEKTDVFYMSWMMN